MQVHMNILCTHQTVCAECAPAATVDYVHAMLKCTLTGMGKHQGVGHAFKEVQL